MQQLKTIIWDWNGTLLNDRNICIDSINILLQRRGHSPLSTDRYKEIFTFPVKHYYSLAGFDFSEEPFDRVAMQFIDLYKDKISDCRVFDDVEDVLGWFRKNGYRQYMVSAMEHDFLIESVEKAGIRNYFAALSGVQDHYANGKAVMAANFCAAQGLNTAQAVFIGDTLHDYEVAKQIGMACILVADGHQSKERLLQAGCPVVDALGDVIRIFKQNA